MKTTRMKIDPAKMAGQTIGRINPAQVDATTEAQMTVQMAQDEALAMQDAAKFARRMRPAAIDTTLWARFTQPSSLIYAASDTAKNQVLAALEQAALPRGLHLPAALSLRAQCAAAAAGMPLRSAAIFRFTPMTPVDATSTSCASQPTAAAARAVIARASSRPCSRPVLSRKRSCSAWSTPAGAKS